MCNKTIDAEPQLEIFGVTQRDLGLLRAQTRALSFSSLLARRLGLYNRKSNLPPLFGHVVDDVMAHLMLEKLRFTTQGSVSEIHKVQQPFLDTYNNVCTSRNMI